MTRKDHVHTARRTKRSILSLVAALAGTLALVAAGLAFAPAANATTEGKVTICHATHSDANPWEEITIAQQAWDRGHSDPSDFEGTPNWTHDDMDFVVDSTHPCPPQLPPPPPPTPSGSADLTCAGAWTITLSGYDHNKTVSAVVDGQPLTLNPDKIKNDGTFSASGSLPAFTSGAHALTVTVEGISGTAATDATGDCTPTPPPTPPTPPTTPGGPTPPTDYCANLAGVQWEGYDCNTGQQVVSAEAVTVVAAPAAGTVAPAKKPAKKPAKVHVAQPANVDAGVATLPTAAKVPSAVNAGGGSSGDNDPNTGLLILAMAATGVCLIATGRLLATRSR